MKKPYQIALAIGIVAIVGVILWNVLSLREPAYRGKNTVSYKGKPLEAWFYGSNTTFFYPQTREAAKKAINALGTNSFPFLLSRLKEKRGNNKLYFEFYGTMPAWIRGRLPYPLSGDDIKQITLNYLREIPGGLSSEQVRALADCVPDLHSPRLRLAAFRLILWQYQTDPSFLPLCRKLLSDEHSGVRLEAAIHLGQHGIVSDPREPRLFPLLLAALDSKEQRAPNLELGRNWVQQTLPGAYGKGFPPMLKTPPVFVTTDEPLRSEILTALERLERYLTPEQKARLRQVVRKAQHERKLIR